MTSLIREIVNGQQLPLFNGKKVSITGSVNNVHPNGKSFEIRTTDNQNVNVVLKNPYNDLLEGIVEVHGTVQNNSIICEEFIQFSSTDFEEFDVESHNVLCKLLHSIPDLYRTEKF